MLPSHFWEDALRPCYKGVFNSPPAPPASENKGSHPISFVKPITKKHKISQTKNQTQLWCKDDRGLSLHYIFIQRQKKIKKAI